MEERVRCEGCGVEGQVLPGLASDTGGFALLLSKYGRYRNSDEDYPDLSTFTLTPISHWSAPGHSMNFWSL